MLNQHIQTFWTDAHKKNHERCVLRFSSYCFQADIFKSIFIITKLQPHTHLKWQEGKKYLFIFMCSLKSYRKHANFLPVFYQIQLLLWLFWNFSKKTDKDVNRTPHKCAMKRNTHSEAQTLAVEAETALSREKSPGIFAGGPVGSFCCGTQNITQK